MATVYSKRSFALSYKHIRLNFGDDARTKIVKGMKIMSELTTKTYGPGGRNVALDYDNGDPKITKDGVTVAKSVFFKDREEELGAKLLKRIAHSTNTFSGDGTTLSTLFATSLISKSIDAIQNGIHPIFLKKGIEKSKKAAVEILNDFKIPVTRKEELMNICMVSSNYTEEIAKIAAEAVSIIDSSTGTSGNLEIEESKTGKNELLLTKGLFIHRGYINEEFSQTNFGNPVTKEVILDYPLILVVHDTFESNEQIIRLMDLAMSAKRPLLIFSMDMREGPLSTMLYNAKKSVIGSCAVNIPYRSLYMVGKEEEFIQDIAVVTGATILKNDGFKIGIKDAELKHFGSATKVIIGEDTTQIIGAGGAEEAIEKHKNEIIYKAEKEESKHFKKIMRERLTRLNQIQAVIGVGGGSEAQIGENRDLIVDSLNSARAALESGVLPGGGSAMFHASKLIPAYVDIDSVEENLGVKIFQETMQEPLKKLVSNF